MRELVECLGLKRAVFGTKDMKHFKIQVLRYDTPPWVLQFLSYQRMVQNEVYVVYSEFHAQLSLARKQLTLANLLKIPTDQKLAFVRDRLKSQGNDSKMTLARIVCSYSDAAMAELEYVLHVCIHKYTRYIH